MDRRNRATFTLSQLEEEAEYQVQVQAKNAFGWGKVSDQFTFRTDTAGQIKSLLHQFHLHFMLLSLNIINLITMSKRT